MDYCAKRTTKQPLFLESVNVCMDGYGNITHFPDGDYRQQMSTGIGRDELDMMRFVFYAKHYVNNRPSLDEIFADPAKEKYEDWLQSDGWSIPMIEKKKNG